ncbi:MAG TPA: DinB family protein, partial [Gemmatimonadaceae bacterium]|nr:DinB family protein [Gemmatimonadaceae bacterium]
MARLEEGRERTWRLMEPLSDEDASIQHDPLMSPIVWDLGHIAHFEALWLLRNLDGPIEFAEMPGIFNPFENPRRVRGQLDLPSLDECREIMADIRAQVFGRMASADVTDENPLLRDGYVYSMVVQHEAQHNETMLQTLQLKQGAPYRAPRSRVPAPAVLAADESARASVRDGTVRFPGGRVCIGTDDRTTAYDNERPLHDIELRPFSIDVGPVTNGDYLEFMRAGGYARPELWSAAGRAWLQEAGVDSPKHWRRDGADWCVRVMDDVRS